MQQELAKSLLDLRLSKRAREHHCGEIGNGVLVADDEAVYLFLQWELQEELWLGDQSTVCRAFGR